MEPRSLQCTPAYGYEFHALAVHPHPTLRALSVRSAFGIRSEFFGGAFLVETVYVLRSLAAFAEELNAEMQKNATKCDSVLTEVFHHCVLHRGILSSSCLPLNSPGSHQTQIQ